MSSYAKCMGYLELQVQSLLTYRLQVSWHPPAGRHCCLYCTIASDQMKVPPASRAKQVTTRTLESLKADHARFMGGGGNIKQAKFYNNVICPLYFDIPLDQVNTV